MVKSNSYPTIHLQFLYRLLIIINLHETILVQYVCANAQSAIDCSYTRLDLVPYPVRIEASKDVFDL